MVKKANYSVGFIGGGNMASSIIGGLVPEILNAESVFVFDPNDKQSTRLKEEFNINICSDNHRLIQQCDVVILAIKPQITASVIAPIAQILTDKKPLIISIAAGVSIDLIQQLIDINSTPRSAEKSRLAIIRVMPNTPSLVKSGASGMYANIHTSNTQKDIAQALMTAVGSALWVDQEKDIDTVTALSGSGPAYFMLFLQSLIDSAMNSGLPKEIAQQLAVDTCIGSAKLIQSNSDNNNANINQLIKNVTSPGGTTEQALLSFQKNQLAHIIDTAFQAALKRSEELGEELFNKL